MTRMMRPIWLCCTLVLLGTSCSAFLSNYPTKKLTGFSSTTTSTQSSSSSRLEAKKGNKSKKKKTSTAAARSGFGAAPSKPKPKVNDDYSVFPRLESQVTETLDPAPDDWATEADQLPQEIYDRLNQIYGLGNFNYDKSETEDPPAMSLAELMSATSDSETTTTSTSNDSNYLFGEKPATGSSTSSTLDLDDLLASATGGSVNTKASSSPAVSSPVVSKQELSIGNLPNFKEFRILHIDPLVLAVDNFFTDEECDRYVSMSSKEDVMQTKSPTVGKDSNAKAQRTSTTYYHHFESVPELMAKASRLLGLDTIDRWEEAQTVRYQKSERFTWHLDALGPNENKPELGGQRLATLLVYLTDLDPDEGGATMFRDLGKNDGEPLKVRPKKGSALLFFPAAGGVPNAPFDVRTLHCGQAVSEDARHDKWISQLWLRQSRYTPTAPPDNSHAKAADAIATYCTS